jgi:Low-density lipoprotein receptor domain class A
MILSLKTFLVQFKSKNLILFPKSFLGTDAACGSMQYQCGTGQCIPVVRICDFYKDCPDNSDETICASKFVSLFFKLSSEMS